MSLLVCVVGLTFGLVGDLLLETDPVAFELQVHDRVSPYTGFTTSRQWVRDHNPASLPTPHAHR